ncbi:MAG: M81 family metallopeptidase [Alphaproteobacteria bacterium]|nr:M81 family metallopeptidase [Alphaproteobacteria bacterium]
MRIAVAGFEHETNTFAPVKADYEAFRQAKAYPPLVRGDDMVEAIRGKNLTASGAITTLQAAGHEVVPLLWCMATPSAHVTEDAYERISDELTGLLEKAGPIDGVMLELHGAMVAEHVDDGEGELLARIRRVVGLSTPIAVALDLHANVTPAMVDLADYIEMYRYYPHIDMADTGKRTAEGLMRILETGVRPHKAFRQIDFLIPINGGCTDFGPAAELYLDILPAMIIDHELDGLCFATGFPHSDIADVGPSVIAFAASQEAADAAAAALADAVAAREAAFLPEFYEADECIRRAQAIAATAAKPVVVADTQDNPGGGGPGDTTGVLRALIDADARGAVIGAMIDPDTAAAAHAAGEGAIADFQIGGKRMPGDEPVRVTCRVLRARSDSWTGRGSMKRGLVVDLGKTALLETEPGGVRIVVASKPSQTADSSIFHHLGLDVENLPIIVVKSSVHFRADFTPLAHAILVATAPGPVVIDHHTLNYRKVRKGVRLMPRGG